MTKTGFTFRCLFCVINPWHRYPTLAAQPPVWDRVFSCICLFDCLSALQKENGWSHRYQTRQTCSPWQDLDDDETWIYIAHRHKISNALACTDPEIKRLVQNETFFLHLQWLYWYGNRLTKFAVMINLYLAMKLVVKLYSCINSLQFCDTTICQLQHFVTDGDTGVVMKGKTPSWKCISTLSGYHTRPVYDVRW